MSLKSCFVRIAIALLLASQASSVLIAANSTPLRIGNHYSPLNKKRARRLHTRYIVLHTTEGKEKGSLNKVTRYGETHYFVAKSGKVYRIIHKSKIAKHAGRSMWEGITAIDNYAIGIEISGYHNKDMTNAQYEALRELLRQLKSLYDIPDEDVVTHSMVAYGRPNHFYKFNHRGRKRCGMVFAKQEVRARLGLKAAPDHDADVAAGRLRVADKELFSVLFPDKRSPISVASTVKPASSESASADTSVKPVSPEVASADASVKPASSEVASADASVKPASSEVASADASVKPASSEVASADASVKPASSESASADASVKPASSELASPDASIKPVSAKSASMEAPSKSFIINRNLTPWEVARESYNHPSTVYIFPNGKQTTGDKIKDWAHIPTNTRIIVKAGDTQPFEGFLEVGKDGDTAKEVAGMASGSSTTIYFFPDGLIRTGAELSGRRSYQKLLNSPPKKTKVLIGYVYGGRIKDSRPPSRIAGVKWNYPSTYYRYPDGNILNGDNINDKAIPAGTLVFYQR